MRIVVNHLTRMEKGYICVAGLDIETESHVRPVLGGRLNASLLARNGGPFDIGFVVDLGPITHAGHPPEVEDCKFDPRQASRVGMYAPNRFWELLKRAARPRLPEIFGPELTRRGATSCAVDVGKGHASLGCLSPSERPDFFLRPRPDKPDQIRVHLRDGQLDLDLGVTDIRLYGDDHVTPNTSLVSQVAQSIKRGVGVVLSAGLTRAFASSPDLSPVHWLQVNNIHLEDNPNWQLG